MPLKSGTFSFTRALPLASSCTGPENRSTVCTREVGRLACGKRRQRHVAAETDLGGTAFEAFDHASVDVVGIHAQAALGEELRVGVRHREAGDVEDAHVHRGDRHERLLAGKLRHADRDRQVLLRPHLLRRRPGPPRRGAPLRSIGTWATPTARAGVILLGAEPPRNTSAVTYTSWRSQSCGHRDLEGAAGLGVDVLHVQHVVALDHQQALARDAAGSP